MEFYQRILSLIEKQESWRESCLNMIASENVVSPSVTRAVASDFGHRYAEGMLAGKDKDGMQLFDRFYQGNKFFDKVEAIAIKLSEELFGAEHANVVPISGVVANLSAFYALGEYGNKISALTIPAGAHISHGKVSVAGVMGMKTIPYAFDNDEMNIDVDGSKKILLDEKPSIMVLGASVFLFPHPVKEMREIADEIGARIVYDAAHVLGLIAGGIFQSPFEEGADVITASTHKTLPGPQGGVIMCKEEFSKKIDNAAFPGLVSNHHLHHVAGYAIALAEMQEFGQDYANQIVKNSKALGQAMHENGFKVLCENKGFTQSHQLLLDVSDFGGGKEFADQMERSNIILNKNMLPWDSMKDSRNPSGIRIGVQELTRVGMKESEMKEIGELIKRVMVDKEEPEKVKSDVVELRGNFTKIHYCFD